MRWLVIAVLPLALLASRAASPQSAKHALALELIETTGGVKLAGDLVAGSFSRLIESIKRNNPSITDKALDELRAVGLEEFRASLPDITELMAAIYESAFDEDELRQMVAFYRPPLGRKMIEKTRGVFQQGQALGAAWGKKVGERIVARIKAEAAKRGYAI